MYRISGVYSIINLKNSKRYIGSTNDLVERFKRHSSKLRWNKHKNPHLQSAWNKYGEDSFSFAVIENVDEDILLDKEQFWMDHFQSYDRKFGYNICKIAGRITGTSRTPEQKEKDRQIQIDLYRRGENSTRAIFTFEIADQIREKYKNEEKTNLAMLAREYGVSKNTIHKIVNYKTYVSKGQENIKPIKKKTFFSPEGKEALKKRTNYCSGNKHYQFGKSISKETAEKIRQATSGKKNHNAVLTEEQVKIIRKMWKENPKNQMKISRVLNIKYHLVNCVIKDKTWTSVKDEPDELITQTEQDVLSELTS
ncbi:MAG: GIY-YIG nuclease family protein [Magnetococcus sp. WYHC-3]